MAKFQVIIPAELHDIAPNYLQNRIRDLDVLKDALNRKDYDSIAKLAHKTKGTAGGYGFMELGELAKSLERAAKSGGSMEANEVLEKMKDYLESVEIS